MGARWGRGGGLALLALACRGAPASPPPPACLAEPLEALAQAPSPLDWGLAELQRGQVVLLGEFHGLEPQIRFAGALAAAAAAQGLAVDLAVEVLPAERQAALDAAAQGEAGRWAEVIGGKYDLRPLGLAAYAELAQIASGARQAGGDLALLGLAPACDPEAAGGREQAVDCLLARDAALAAAVEARLARGRRVVALVGFRHADLGAAGSLGAQLAAAHPGRVSSLLLSGPGAQRPDGGWERLCEGLPDALGAALGRPYTARLDRAPGSGWGRGCLEDGAEGRLSEAFSALGWIGDPGGWGAPRPLDWSVLEAVSDPDLRRWNRFEVEVLGQPFDHLRDDRRVWWGRARAEAAALGALSLPPAPACAP